MAGNLSGEEILYAKGHKERYVKRITIIFK